MSRKDRNKEEKKGQNAGVSEEEILTEETASQASDTAPQQEPDTEEKGAQEKKEPTAEEKLAELQDRLVRNMAEFDNYRKRTEKEKASMFDLGVRSTAEKILPTIDNFERSLAARPEDEAAKAYADGMEMVYRQLLKNLDEIGIRPIEALGQEFDPNLHNAVMHEEDDSGEANKVIEEFQKGYMYKDHVVRHSMVKVLN